MKTNPPYSIPLYIILALAIQASFFCQAIKAQDQGQSDRTVALDCPPQTPAGTPVTFTAKIGSGISNLPIKWHLSAGTITAGQGTPSITVDTTGLGGQTITATLLIGEASQSRSLSCPLPISQPSAPTARLISTSSQPASDTLPADNTQPINQAVDKSAPASTQPSSQVSDQTSAANQSVDKTTPANAEPSSQVSSQAPATNAEAQGQTSPTGSSSQVSDQASAAIQPVDQSTAVSAEPSSQVSDQASAATAEAQGQVSQLQNQLTQLQSQLNSTTQGTADGLSSSARASLQNQANQIQSQLEQLQGKLKTNIQSQTSDRASEATTKLQSQVSQLQGQLSQVQSKLTATAQKPLEKVNAAKENLTSKLGKLTSLTGKLQGTLDKVNNTVTTKTQDQLNKVTAVTTSVNTTAQSKIEIVSAAANTKVTDLVSQTDKLQNKLSTANQPLASVEQKMQSLLSAAKPDTKPYLELAQQEISTAQESFAAGKLQQGTQQTKATVQTLIETSKNGTDTTALQKSLVEGVEAQVSKAVADKEAVVGSADPTAQKAREALNQGHGLLEQGAFTQALDAFSESLQQISAP